MFCMFACFVLHDIYISLFDLLANHLHIRTTLCYPYRYSIRIININIDAIYNTQTAEEFGVPVTLSTMSICSIETVMTVARQATKPFWFQLYVMKNHIFAKKLVDRAKVGLPYRTSLILSYLISMQIYFIFQPK